MNTMPTFSHLRVPDLKIFVKKYNRNFPKNKRIVITGLRKKQLVNAINDKMMNHPSTTELMNDYIEMGGKQTIVKNKLDISNEIESKPIAKSETPKKSSSLPEQKKRISQSIVKSKMPKKPSKLPERKTKVSKPIAKSQMPSLEDMKALYANKQRKTKVRRSLISEGEEVPLVATPRKKFNLEFNDLDEAIRKDRPNLKEKTITGYLYLINLISDGVVANNLNWLINSKKIIEKIDKLPLLRQRDILNAIIVALKAINAPEEIINEYSNLRDDINLDYFKSKGNKQQVKFWEKRIDERK